MATKTSQYKSIAWGLFAALLVIGEIIAGVHYGKFDGEVVGYGIGTALIGLIVHGLMIRKIDFDTPENKARLRNTIIFDAVYIFLMYYSNFMA